MSNVWWRDGDVLVDAGALDRRPARRDPRRRRARSRRSAGYRVREGSFTLPTLLRAEEAFTSSAVREIMPVVAVDGRELPARRRRAAAAGAPRGAVHRRLP